jgi:hypothetical protein
MKNLISILLAIMISLPCVVLAGTYLTASTTSDADGFIVSVDSVPENVAYQQVTIIDRDGVTTNVVLLKDVTGVTQGAHNIIITPYKGAWEGSPVPFAFTKPDVSALGLQLSSGTVQ